MLRFAAPLTPAALALITYCLEVAAGDVRDLYDDDGWAAMFPHSGACFTRELARNVLTDMREKLDRPEMYRPTDYHWLLMYEVLQVYVALVNDNQPADIIQELRTLVQADDAVYLDSSRASGRKGRLTIDFGGFIDEFFWDTDFLLEAGLYEELNAEQRQNLAITPELFGVIQRFAPHPDELILRPLAVDPTEASAADDEPRDQ